MIEGKNVAWVMAGGALGAAARYLLGSWALRRYGTAFPWGTLVINLTGCFLLGAFIGLRTGGRHAVPVIFAPAFGVGFVGAYTTFSTFAAETVALVEAGKPLAALGYVGSSVVVGLVAAAAGLAVGRQV
jgi:CrcB protein